MFGVGAQQRGRHLLLQKELIALNARQFAVQQFVDGQEGRRKHGLGEGEFIFGVGAVRQLREGLHADDGGVAAASRSS